MAGSVTVDTLSRGTDMIIPHRQLQPATLDALIEEFVTRDGAVHGHSEVPLESQVKAVRRQLDCGLAAVVFDPEEETCTIVLRDQLSQHVE